MTEQHFQAVIIQMCRVLGIAWYHTADSRRSVPGWPDLALCGGRGFMLRELKTERGELSADQRHWGLMLRHVGVSWDVWRPADLQSGRIRRELDQIR